MKENPYQRVSCSFYDSLEAWATLRKDIRFVIQELDGPKRTLISKIQDLQTKDQSEYLLLENGEWIRLDYIQAAEVTKPNSQD